MENNNFIENNNSHKKEFVQRLDFYWQYISAYSIVLFIYGIAKGSIDEGTITMRWQDPVVLLLFVFMVLSSLFLLYNFLKKKSIVIGEDFIQFRTRTKERTYKTEDIQKIYIGKYHKAQLPVTFRIIKIRVKSRKYLIRFRPSNYWNDKELLHKINELKQAIEKRKS